MRVYTHNYLAKVAITNSILLAVAKAGTIQKPRIATTTINEQLEIPNVQKSVVIRVQVGVSHFQIGGFWGVSPPP